MYSSPLGNGAIRCFSSAAPVWGSTVLGRLKPGITFEQCTVQYGFRFPRVSPAFPEVNQGVGAKLSPLRNAMLGNVPQFLLVLLAGVGFVLLIACVKCRPTCCWRAPPGRAREFAIRASLGATQGRVVRQLLTESVLLGAGRRRARVDFGCSWNANSLGVLPTALPARKKLAIDLRVLYCVGSFAVCGNLFLASLPP